MPEKNNKNQTQHILILHVLIVLFSGQKSSWTTLAQDGGSNNKIVLIRAHGNTRHRCTLRGLTELLQWPSNQYENLSITITLIWQGFTLFESVRDYAICKTGTRRFLTPYQFIKGKQYSCPPVNSLAGKLIRSIMFVSLVVFLMMFAGRAVSYELEDYDEDEEDFAMIYAKIERF